MRVYILRSAKTGKFYCGHTADLDDRLYRHNSGQSKSTVHGVPWNLVWSFETSDRSEAVLLETKIKSRGIGRFLAENEPL